MIVGLDIGSSLTKMAQSTSDGHGLFFSRDPYGVTGGSAMSDEQMADLVERLADDGVAAVGLTGTGAVRFKKIAATVTHAPAMVLRPGIDAIENELRLQADGVRRLLAAEGETGEQFMLVAIGTGTSFTMVGPGAVRPYLPGLAVGGRYLEKLVGLVNIPVTEIDRMAAQGVDSDLLVRHVNPQAKFPTGDFVVASLGRLGEADVPATPENVAAGAVKSVATAVAGHLLSIRQHPDWSWDGLTVFIGTPVEKSRVLRDWLTYFGAGLKLSCRFPENGSFAGAVGAFCFASEARDRPVEAVRPPSWPRRQWRAVLRRADATQVVIGKTVKRG